MGRTRSATPTNADWRLSAVPSADDAAPSRDLEADNHSPRRPKPAPILPNTRMTTRAVRAVLGVIRLSGMRPRKRSASYGGPRASVKESIAIPRFFLDAQIGKARQFMVHKCSQTSGYCEA